ncbi:MAG: hypothetical protein E7338_02705 [Clostridiales bacterium]|nr:hypothetical protein [Clostridiales bacterium]
MLKMREIDDFGRFICRYQADLFEYSAKQLVASKDFVKKYAYSNLAERMDDRGFWFEAIDVPQAFSEMQTIKAKKKISIYRSDVIRWIGYIYRYICYIYEKPMKEVYKRISPQELYDVFDAYHSLDNELAIKRILEAKCLDFEKKRRHRNDKTNIWNVMR